MTWKVRHEGSPVAVEDLTLAEVAEGLQEGRWEPTDEVMGPDDGEWTAMENHAALADIAADIEPPPPRTYDDETRLDMNALIDVTLVLLIFFIITSVVFQAARQRMQEGPRMEKTDKEIRARPVSPELVKQLMVQVKITMRNDRVVYQVEGMEIAEEELLPVLRGFVRDERKTELLILSDPDVPRQAIITLQDKAKGAKLQKVNLAIPGGEEPPKPEP